MKLLLSYDAELHFADERGNIAYDVAATEEIKALLLDAHISRGKCPFKMSSRHIFFTVMVPLIF